VAAAAAGDVSVVVEGAEAATVAVEAASSLAVSTDSSAGTPLARGVPVASHQGHTNEKPDLSDSARDSIL
jgi:hypothetical protein